MDGDLAGIAVFVTTAVADIDEGVGDVTKVIKVRVAWPLVDRRALALGVSAAVCCHQKYSNQMSCGSSRVVAFQDIFIVGLSGVTFEFYEEYISDIQLCQNL